MLNIRIRELLLTIAFSATLIGPIWAVIAVQGFYSKIFRLSHGQVIDAFAGATPLCKKLSGCNLLPGDVLIRRYITQRTLPLDRLANLYFTHSAFYLGDGKIVEAVGTEKNPKDEILINPLSGSDWSNDDLENFVIIRPKNYRNKLEKITANLEDIAGNSNYVFGLPDDGKSRATCADLIFDQLIAEEIIFDPNQPKIITPDYLFWFAKNNANYFEIAGYNIQ